MRRAMVREGAHGFSPSYCNEGFEKRKEYPFMNHLMKMVNAYLKKHWPRILLVIFLSGLIPGIIGGIYNQSIGMAIDSSKDMGFLIPWFGVNTLTSFVTGIFASYLSLEIYGKMKEEKIPRAFGFLEQIGERGGEMFILNVLIYVKSFLWGLLLVIPGVVKGLEYQRAKFLKYQDPEMSNDECFALAREQMNGKKMDLFLLQLQAVWPAILGSLFLIFVTFDFSSKFVTSVMSDQAPQSSLLTSGLLLLFAIILALVLDVYGGMRSVLVQPIFNCLLDDPNFDPDHPQGPSEAAQDFGDFSEEKATSFSSEDAEAPAPSSEEDNPSDHILEDAESSDPFSA